MGWMLLCFMPIKHSGNEANEMTEGQNDRDGENESVNEGMT